MALRTPSYLYLRNGIYYFQLRVPVHKNKGIEKCCKSTHIRRSTGTRDKVKALGIARRWWTEIMSDTVLQSAEKYEALAEHQDELYRRGKIIYQQLSALDSHDGLEVEEFLINNIGCSGYTSQFDYEALAFYQSYINKEVQAQKVSCQHVEVQRVRELVDSYLAFIGKDNKNQKTKDKYKSQLYLFCEMIDAKYITDVTYDDIVNNFIFRLGKLPKNHNNANHFKKKDGSRYSIKELIEITERKQLQCISKSTEYGLVSKAKSFLDWCEKRELIKKSVLTAFEGIKKPEEKDKIKVLPFSEDDYSKIFYTEVFTSKKYFRHKTYQYWGLLLAAYTGARLGEIAQIHLEDIKYDKDAKCYYIDLIECDDESRRLKNKNSRRKVPLHNDLVKLGLIKYAEYLSGLDQKQLFAEMKPDKYGYWHGKLGKWFNDRYSKKCGVKVRGTDNRKERTSFHSFRHTFINQGKQQRLDDRVIQEIVGHSYDNGTTKQYEEEFELVVKYNVIKKMDIGIDVSKILAWE